MTPGGEDRPAAVAAGKSADQAVSRHKLLLERLRTQGQLLRDIASVYGVQMANYIFPLVIVPYLSRVLGPATWGLLAMSLAFGMYGGLIVEFGFIFSASRELAGLEDRHKIEEIVAGVTGAKIILALVVIAGAFAARIWVPVFAQHPLLLWAAVISELLKAALPNYFFYGMQRITTGSLLDISARAASLLGVFFFVRGPLDAWHYFALQAAGALVALVISHWMIYSQFSIRTPRVSDGIRMLKDSWPMFLFKSSHSMFTLGNSFVLGLFAPAQAVGYYAGAEKINAAAVGLLSPLNTALYARTAKLAKTDLVKAAALTRMCLAVMLAVSVVLVVVMWLGAPLIIRIILGRQYGPSASVLRILALRAPMVAWTYVIGFQWLLVLGLEKPFQRVTISALAVNVALATYLAPHFSYIGMGWSVISAELFAVIGMYWIVKRRNLSPFSIRSAYV
jgi:PST family polysaccharide transporter